MDRCTQYRQKQTGYNKIVTRRKLTLPDSALCLRTEQYFQDHVMADVFISYSRRDTDFMRLLHTELSQTYRRDIWVDWEDIPLSADWWDEICEAIEGADTFCFIISPDSVTSEVCRKEIEHAVLNNKRFVPISFRDIKEIDPTLVHPAVQTHNWVVHKDADGGISRTSQLLIQALETDLEYVRQHTRLLVRAREWVENKRSRGFLLTATEVDNYQHWLHLTATKQPHATPLQLEYVLASQAARNHRYFRLLGLAIVLLMIAGALVTFGLIQSEAAAKAQATSAARALKVAEATSTFAAQEAIILAGRATSEAQQAALTAIAVEQTRISEDVANRVNNVNITLTALAQPTANSASTLQAENFAATLTTVHQAFDLMQTQNAADALSTTVALQATQSAVEAIIVQNAADAASTSAALYQTQSALDAVVAQNATNASDLMTTLVAFSTREAQAYATQEQFVFNQTQVASTAVEVAALPPTNIPEALPSEEDNQGVSPDTETPIPTLLPSATATMTASPTLTHTSTATATLTPSLTATATATSTTAPTATQPATVTNTPAPTETPIVAVAGHWFVNPAGSDSNACHNPAVPCASLSAALALAADGDTVELAPGVYLEAGGMTLEKNVRIIGENRDLTVINGGGVYTVFTISAGAQVFMQHVSIIGGNALEDGGGILNYGETTLVDVFIGNNIAAGRGGGIANFGGLDVSASILSQNAALQDAAIYSDEAARFTIDRPSIWTYTPVPYGALYIGGVARVMPDSGEFILRAGSSTVHRVITTIPANTLVNVVGGPEFDDRFRWWRIRTDNGTLGWAHEATEDAVQLVAVDVLEDTRARTDILLVYASDSFTIVNLAPHASDWLSQNIVFRSANNSYRLVQFDNFMSLAGHSLQAMPPSGCLEIWRNQALDRPPVTDDCPRRIAWSFTRPEAMFWTEDTFEVLVRDTVVATCTTQAGRCEVALPK
jgi:hypothetical protein